jgi:hypothetical protein
MLFICSTKKPRFDLLNTGNDHLIKFQLIEIVFYQLIKIVVIS